MSALVAGLALFLGVHSVRIVAEDWRARQIARFGEGPWKAIYSLAALAGFVLIVWGYGAAREQPVLIWAPPPWTRHLAALLTLPAFVLLAAAYVPGNRIRAALGHPMLLGVKLWALAHLASNGMLADVVLFGSFLTWAVLDFRAARRRERAAAGSARPAGVRQPAARDAVAVGVGVVLWAAFATFLHEWLFGVRPLA